MPLAQETVTKKTVSPMLKYLTANFLGWRDGQGSKSRYCRDLRIEHTKILNRLIKSKNP
jgi:hypothetical protein